jgi:TROVE domain-containing protein
MAKLNKAGVRTAKPSALSPVTTVAQDTKTFEGAAAWSRDAKSDLFLLAVTNFYGEDTFYEKANDRNQRYVDLVHRVAQEDPAWLARFLPWLRREANIRTAAVVGAVEAARVLASDGQPGTQMGPARRIISETLLRADEPAEALSYWLQTYGKKIPAPIRRGIADVAQRLYNERSFIKWDSDRSSVRMADVIELTHPTPVAGEFDHRNRVQSDLFKYMLDSRRRPTEVPASLQTIRYRNTVLMDLQDRKSRKLILAAPNIGAVLSEAGMTWEALSSSGPMDKAAWEAIIPNMGYMALLRNLRNFQEAGISENTVLRVAAQLKDPEQVRRSRQLPYRFLSAYLEATSANWSLALETALDQSLANIPALPGTTLVLVDTSSSMSRNGFSAKSKITPVMAGALFGVALAAKGERVDLVGYANGVFSHPVRKGSGVLRETDKFIRRIGEVGHGTETAAALKASWHAHNRVVIVTDGQTFGPNRLSLGWGRGNVGDQIPANVPIYAFNMMGYAPAMMETSKTRHELGGLTDRTFAMIPLVEAGQRAQWPWEVAS